MTSFAVSTVCLRRYDLAEALVVADRLGFDTVDLAGLRGLCEHVPVNGTAAEMAAAAAVFTRSGLRAASVNADPGSFDGADDPAEVMRRVELVLGFCDDAGVDLLVLPSGEKTADRAAPPAYRRMAGALNEVAEAAGKRGVRLAVEAPYFGRPVDTLDRTAEFAELLDPEVLLAIDASHIEGAGESVEEGWRRLGHRAGIVHLRDAVPGDIRRVIGRGSIDFGSLLSAMSASGYHGDIVLELETRDSPFATKEDEILDAVRRLQPL